ncbi:mercuric reductase [Pseudoroseomonas deserti]|uniref:Mercuric reductase n=1 Tax=Teichococcus deserti TaxID=1817963 RepID=A0A1V2H452_9PROT|nr:FAD-containing oxidoreductase [Pseudoroseomonas deserti]ONG55804.1 mercuric reductase [Pseudoroseomonas deserti]
MTAFDSIVVGAGQAGPSLAVRLAEAGKKVALVERSLLGGTCVNRGCMPTKALVASARAAHVARRAADWGIAVGGPVTAEMPRITARAQKVASDARGNLQRWLEGVEGVALVQGHARFTAPFTLQVGQEVLTAPQIFLNVGARAVVPDGFEGVPFLTSSSILQITHLPRHLVILGGSYIGLEFAQAYRRFGSAVTVLERGPKLLPREDADISDEIRSILEAEGISVRCGVGDVAASADAGGVTLGFGEGQSVSGSDLLIAVGRRPNTDELGLAMAGIAVDPRGFITVDERLQTNVPGVYALGDCNGRGAFTHTAYNDFEIVAANLLDGEDRRVSERVSGYALYIDPPLGRVGMTEAAARGSGLDVQVSTRPMSRVGRAVEKGETAGFMKVVAERDTGRILGAAILGVEGDEAIHGLLDAMHAGVPQQVLRWAVPIHPTVSELIPTLLQGLR